MGKERAVVAVGVVRCECMRQLSRTTIITNKHHTTATGAGIASRKNKNGRAKTYLRGDRHRAAFYSPSSKA